MSWQELWVPTWSPGTVIFRAAVVYLFVQLVFRCVGRKELARYSTFDIAVLFLITVAVRQSIVGNDTSLTTAFLALTTIVVVDWALSYLSFRSPLAARILEGPIPKLVSDGRTDERALHRNRISREQLLAYLREHGHTSLDEVAEARLERNGHVSFVFRGRALPG
ncbi:MAG: DUF421 domain-containing protein [Polyangia bacterium]|jgi:uncharacterized membrane protein YcaP (DUF421 family)